jgi:hypothetical protein
MGRAALRVLTQIASFAHTIMLIALLARLGMEFREPHAHLAHLTLWLAFSAR